ncbi:O-methyltransferase [Isoptericola halotolerans]|uniref:O-methyltransferase YrrM n=1 Tax=Isoptericola halotolerans TaxID=300560 RepID=A0ABX2A111_9MICO|nr:O-methyltransferase [Isoptericola halotolerans]NOV96518.1 putative O-methyltransferase YrrM [Isoptericola halotolerans]
MRTCEHPGWFPRTIAAQQSEGAAITTGVGAQGDPTAAWAFSETFLTEDVTLLRARERAAQLGCASVSPGTGALLQVVAAALRARAVVEIGTGAGVASLWMLRGMAPDGVLTTIDAESEHQRAAKLAYAEEGVPVHRTRTIVRPPLDVLPRLTDGAYDLVLVAIDPHARAEYVEAAVRLLRPGGVLVVVDALLGGRVLDPDRHDETTALVRRLAHAVREDERLVPAMVPVGDGILLAVRR